MSAAPRSAPSSEIREKRSPARRWADHVTAGPAVPDTWHYLLSEAGISSSHASWPALKAIAP